MSVTDEKIPCSQSYVGMWLNWLNTSRLISIWVQWSYSELALFFMMRSILLWRKAVFNNKKDAAKFLPNWSLKDFILEHCLPGGGVHVLHTWKISFSFSPFLEFQNKHIYCHFKIWIAICKIKMFSPISMLVMVALFDWPLYLIHGLKLIPNPHTRMHEYCM